MKGERKMKRFVSGLLVGFLLAIPAFAAADQISMVGKKVQVEYPVIVDGERLSVNAVAIDGTSYAPLRAVGEAIGYDVKFQNKTVVFESKTERKEGEQVQTQTPAETPAQPAQEPEFYYTLDNIDEAIAGQETGIKAIEMSINMLMSSGGSPEKIEELRQKKREAEELLERLKRFKEQLQAQQQR